jgi:hypothetical protein
MSKPVFHSPASAGRVLNLTPQRIRQLCDDGQLECLRDVAGRRLIPADAVEEFLHRRTAVRNASAR